MAIKSFKNGGTEDIASNLSTKRAGKLLSKDLHGSAYRKLIFLDNAATLEDLRAWKSLRLEKLKGRRAGQLSIRINDQYRICFRWIDNNAHNVEIVDYH